MNRPEPDVGEFETQNDQYLAGDEIPDTLVNVLKHIAIDFVPETRAAADYINNWIAEQSELPVGTTAKRVLCSANFVVAGTSINAWAQPYRFFLLQRVQDEFANLDEASQQAVHSLLAACDMTAVLETKLSRRIDRTDNLEVWA